MRKFIKPKNLDLASLATEKTYCLLGRCNKPGSSDRKVRKFKEYKTKNLIKHFAKCYYFVNNLILRNDREHEGDRSVFTNLSQEILQEGMGEASYDVCLSLLYALNVIECDNEYEPPFAPLRSKDPTTGLVREAKCFGYRLTELYWGETETIPADPQIIDRKKRKARKKLNRCVLEHTAFAYQREQLLSHNYTVDKNANLQPLLGQLNHKGKIITQANIDRMREYLAVLSEGSLEYFNIDDYGRLWSAMVLLQREGRSFVRDSEGNPLWKLDFKSSYCFHLIKLIKDKKGHCVFYNKYNNNNQYVPTFLSELEDEVDFLHQRCMDEGLYEYITQTFEQKFERRIHEDLAISIQLAKDSWNQTFLNRGSCKSDLSQHIRTLFPRINTFIQDWGRYRIWRDLMRSEADLVHHRIVARIAREIGLECTLFAIHDAIVTDQYHDSQILGIMMEEAEAYFKFKCRIDTKPLIEEHQSEYAEELAFVEKYS